MVIPVVVLGESLLDAVVEVLVVGEDNVATDIVELYRKKKRVSDAASNKCQLAGGGKGGKPTKPSGVTSVEARPPALSLESRINHEGPSYD